jgi:hypothetical protein
LGILREHVYRARSIRREGTEQERGDEDGLH